MHIDIINMVLRHDMTILIIDIRDNIILKTDEEQRDFHESDKPNPFDPRL